MFTQLRSAPTTASPRGQERQNQRDPRPTRTDGTQMKALSRRVATGFPRGSSMPTMSTPTLPAVSATTRVRRPRLLRRLTAVMAGTAAAILGVGILPANATGYPFGTPSGSVGDLL